MTAFRRIGAFAVIFGILAGCGPSGADQRAEAQRRVSDVTVAVVRLDQAISQGVTYPAYSDLVLELGTRAELARKDLKTAEAPVAAAVTNARILNRFWGALVSDDGLVISESEFAALGLGDKKRFTEAQTMFGRQLNPIYPADSFLIRQRNSERRVLVNVAMAAVAAKLITAKAAIDHI